MDDKKILDDINLNLFDSDLTLLLGPNGAGKSSLVKTVMGDPSYKVCSGEVTFNDKEILSLSISERARLGIFLQFQNPPEIEGVRFLKFLKSAFEETVGKTFSSALEFKNYCIEELKRFEINTKLIERNLNEGFSGGEKKLSEFIQMIILRPRFCILDEPDSGLDVDARKEILKVIKKMQKDFGTKFLVISHYIEFGENLNPDKVVILKNGKVLSVGDGTLLKDFEEKGFNF